MYHKVQFSDLSSLKFWPFSRSFWRRATSAQFLTDFSPRTSTNSANLWKTYFRDEYMVIRNAGATGTLMRRIRTRQQNMRSTQYSDVEILDILFGASLGPLWRLRLVGLVRKYARVVRCIGMPTNSPSKCAFPGSATKKQLTRAVSPTTAGKLWKRGHVVSAADTVKDTEYCLGASSCTLLRLPYSV